MDYRVNEDEKWNRLAFGKCKYGFLIEAYRLGKESNQAEKEAEQWASMSMRIVDESLYKPKAPQPFRNDVIRAKVESANIDKNFNTNNVPFN